MPGPMHEGLGTIPRHHSRWRDTAGRYNRL